MDNNNYVEGKTEGKAGRRRPKFPKIIIINKFIFHFSLNDNWGWWQCWR